MDKVTRTYLNIIGQSVNYDPAPTALVAKAVRKFKGKKYANNEFLIQAVQNDRFVKSAYNAYIEAKEKGEEDPEQYLDDMEDCIEEWLDYWADDYMQEDQD